VDILIVREKGGWLRGENERARLFKIKGYGLLWQEGRIAFKDRGRTRERSALSTKGRVQAPKKNETGRATVAVCKEKIPRLKGHGRGARPAFTTIFCNPFTLCGGEV